MGCSGPLHATGRHVHRATIDSMSTPSLDIRPLTPDRLPDLVVPVRAGWRPEVVLVRLLPHPRLRLLEGQQGASSRGDGSGDTMTSAKRTVRRGSSLTTATRPSAGSASGRARTTSGSPIRRSWSPSTTSRSGRSSASSSGVTLAAKASPGSSSMPASPTPASTARDSWRPTPSRSRRARAYPRRTPTAGRCRCSSAPVSRSPPAERRPARGRRDPSSGAPSGGHRDMPPGSARTNVLRLRTRSNSRRHSAWSNPLLERAVRLAIPVREALEVHMTTGTIKKVVADRGFGFIAAEDAKEYFFHRGGLDSSLDFDRLIGGERVEFEIETEPQGSARYQGARRLTRAVRRPPRHAGARGEPASHVPAIGRGGRHRLTAPSDAGAPTERSSVIVRTAFVSTYPPRRCGIAIFHPRPGVGDAAIVKIVALHPTGRSAPYPLEVHHRIRRDQPANTPTRARRSTGASTSSRSSMSTGSGAAMTEPTSSTSSARCGCLRSPRFTPSWPIRHLGSARCSRSWWPAATRPSSCPASAAPGWPAHTAWTRAASTSSRTACRTCRSSSRRR